MSMLMFFLGLGALVIGAELLVRGASRLASSLGVSPLVVGLTVVAYGTSAPEVAVSVNAVLSGNTDLAVGNVVGSNIFNILGILGVSAFITPLSSSGITGIDLGVMAGFALALWGFSASGYRITRLEGIVMLFAYAGFVGWLVARV